MRLQPKIIRKMIKQNPVRILYTDRADIENRTLQFDYFGAAAS